MCCRTATAYYEHTSKYKACCKNLLPCQCIHPDDYPNDRGDDRLYVAVHADEGRPYMFLTEWNEKVTDECCEKDEES